jgi:hypothetical protein
MRDAFWILVSVFVCGMLSGATCLLMGAILLDYINRRRRP